VPLARWSGPELAAEITKAGLASPISPSSVLRILAEHPIKPWQYQSWISPRDPDFAAKATVILDLYQGYYQGKRLRPGDRILSVDAKPSIQARARCHATSPPRRGRPVRVEHEYQRHGALALLAALDVRTGKVFASTPHDHRDRPVHGPDDPGHEPAAVQRRAPGCPSSQTTAQTTAARPPSSGCATPGRTPS
jgi:hypothetical protein